ncbi:MAG: hypothetical protein ACXIVF_16045 [Rhizobiaceae bacterium]
MASKPNSHFSALLDALIASEPEAERVQVVAPSLRVDLLDQLERLQASSPAFVGQPAMEEYQDVAAALDELDGVAERVGVPEDLPAVDPETIARELGGLVGLSEKQLALLRRDFAKHNHPDAQPDDLRERAELRMRVANMLIDDARRNAAKKAKR